ncbi:MAG: heparan-alpha-glucosaminide N-acetyltransferase domain-containing protein [Candidatus Hodarchaeota archaeon]
MSSKEEKKPDLVSYLKEEIPIEDIRDYASPQRIRSIDFVKGFAIIFIIIAHTSSVWFDDDWIYIHGMAYAALDILGPSLFIFLSALSVIFSIRRKKGKLPDKVIRNRIFSRGFTIIVMGMIFNLIGLSVVRPDIPFPLNLWGWNILMFIGFSQIFSYYAVKLKKWFRAVIGIIIILISPIFREFLYLEKDSNPLIWLTHFIVTSPTPEITLFPWLSVCFISSIFGEYLYDTMILGTEDAYFRLFRLFMIWGIIFVVLGVILGLRLQTPETMVESEYPHLRLYSIMNQQNYYNFPGMPEFLIRGTMGNMFYNLGAALLLIAICFYLIDIKNHDNKFTSMIEYYGKISLSLFLVEYVFLLLYIGQFSIVVFPFVCLAYLGFLGFLLYIWNEYGNGVGSPEWIMIQISRIGQKTGETVKKEAKKIEKKIEEIVIKETEKIKETFKKKKKIEKVIER